MSYAKFGLDALGRLVERHVTDGNLIILPHRPAKRPESGPERPAHAARCARRAKVIMFPKL